MSGVKEVVLMYLLELPQGRPALCPAFLMPLCHGVMTCHNVKKHHEYLQAQPQCTLHMIRYTYIPSVAFLPPGARKKQGLAGVVGQREQHPGKACAE